MLPMATLPCYEPARAVWLQEGSKTTSWWWIYLYYLFTSVCSSVYGFIIIICIYTAANAWRYVVMSPLDKMIFRYTCPLVHPHAWFIHRCDWCVILFRWSQQHVLRMGHGNKVSTLAMAVWITEGVSERFWEVFGRKLNTISCSNSLIIGKYLAANERKYVLCRQLCTIHP